MERDREPLVPYWLLYAGLAFGALAQILIGWFVIATGSGVLPIGNATAFIVCVGAIFLIRARQKGRP